MPIDKTIEDIITELRAGNYIYKLEDGTTIISVPSFNLIS